jgi:hypothetical protein
LASGRFGDVVADPLAVPPLDRRDRDALNEHLEVQVVAQGRPVRRFPALALLHRVAVFTSISRGGVESAGPSRDPPPPCAVMVRGRVGDHARVGGGDHAVLE